MALEVRHLLPADKPQWLPLWRGYLVFYETTFDAAQADLTFARFLDPSEPMFALVAEDASGALVGVVHCVLHRGTWSVGDFCYLEDLFVVPSARGQDIGRALIEAVYARADAIGCAPVYWLTHESNQTARHLYDRIATRSGFIHYRHG